MFLFLDSEVNLQISCFKIVQNFPHLFPAEDFVLWTFCDYTVQIIEEAPYETVRTAMIDLSLSIIEKIKNDPKKVVQFAKSLMKILNFPCASKLVKELIKINPTVDKKETEEFFKTLMEAYSEENLFVSDYLLLKQYFFAFATTPGSRVSAATA